MPHNGDLFTESYKLFEDRFRGSEIAIRNRLELYLPLIAGFAPDDSRIALDIGSGRGEWLRLLTERGWRAVGVEPNDIAEASGMSGAEIVRLEALEYLRGCPDHHFSLVTAFHVVEHLETDYLLRVLAEIRRVLRPGGILLLETPNPENLTVSSWSFHLDPTHKAPIPPLLLQHFVQSAGFSAANVSRLNGIHAEGNSGSLSTVLSTLFQSGPDYVVIAHAPGDEDDATSRLIRLFANQTSQRSPSDIGALLLLTADTDRVIQQMQERTANLEQSCSSLDRHLSALSRQLAERDQQLAALYNSTSWRLSAPIRAAGLLSSRAISKLKRLLRSIFDRTTANLAHSRASKFLPSRAQKLLFPIKRPQVPPSEKTRLEIVWSIDADDQNVGRWKRLIDNRSNSEQR